MLVKALHIILSIAVLLSTTGFTLSEHVCQSELQSVSVFSESGGCDSKMAPCQRGGTCCSMDEKEGKSCCTSSSEYFQSDQDKQTQAFEFKQLKSPDFLAVITVVFCIQLPIFETAQVNYLTYRPPIVCKDLLVFLQTFLC